MVEKVYKEDFILGAMLFLFALGVLVLGIAGHGQPYPIGTNLFWTFVISGTSAFFALIFAIKAVLK